MRRFYSLFFVIGVSNFAFANTQKQLRTFASEILDIRHDEEMPRKEFYELYRKTIQANAKLIPSLIENSFFKEEITKDKRLAAFFNANKSAVLFALNANLLSLIPDSQIDRLDTVINQSVQLYKFSNTTAITMLLDPKQGVDLQDVPKVLRNFLNLVLNNYFDALDIRSKRAILADVLRLEQNAPPEEILAAILNHCGPILQKSLSTL